MRKRYIQSAENGVGQTQKQGNTAANRRAAEQRADRGNKSHDTPLSGKEKGDTEKRCRRNGTAALFYKQQGEFLSIASITILLPLLPLRSALSLLPLLSLRSALTVVFELL